MGYEISPTCFYLTKRSLIQKPNNYEVITELKSMITKNIPTHLPPANHHRNVIVDFMAYASKLAIKKRNLKTYNDFFSSLWSFFSFLFKSYNWEDIVFDVYKETSFKASEQRHRTSVEGTYQLLQVLINLLPLEIDRIWTVSKNKKAMQRLFTKWILNKVESEKFDKQLFLGGLHKENDVMCVSFVIGFC